MWIPLLITTFLLITCCSMQHIKFSELPYDALQNVFQGLHDERDFQNLMSTSKQVRRLGVEVDPIFAAHSRLKSNCGTSDANDVLSQLYMKDKKRDFHGENVEINHHSWPYIDLTNVSNECIEAISDICQLHKSFSSKLSRYKQYQLNPVRVRSKCSRDCPAAKLSSCPVELELVLENGGGWRNLTELITKFKVDIQSIAVIPVSFDARVNKTATVLALSRLIQSPSGNITSLDLKFNNLGNDAISLLLSEISGKQNKLEVLNLDGNIMSTRSLIALSQLFTSSNCKIKFLSLACNNLDSDIGFFAFTETLRTHENSLLYLDLEHNELSDTGMRYLARMLLSPRTRLRVLLLGNNYISDYGIQNLYMGLISPFNHLTTLDLNENLFRAEGMLALGQALRHGTSQLRELDISGNAIQLHTTIAFDYFVRSLKWSRLSHLDMQGCGLTNVNLLSLSKLLKHPANRIKTLVLSNNAIGNRGIEALAGALKATSCKVSYLDLQFNRIGYVGYKALSSALSSPECKLEYLNLLSTGMKSKSAISLVQGLMSNKKLKHLVLMSNHIGNKGARAFLHLFNDDDNSRALKSLDLSFNEIGNQMILELTESIIKSPTNLRHVKLKQAMGIDPWTRQQLRQFENDIREQMNIEMILQ